MVTDAHPRLAGFDTALSHALLIRVASGEAGETLRLHRPGRVVAFGRHDTVTPGYREAVAAARSLGFEAVERLAGGRAAVFHEGTIAFAWAIPHPVPREGIRDRFAELAGIMVAAFRSVGVDARIGEIPGEYCPGAYSVNAGGRVKVMGTGQRLVRGAAHVGGVVVVEGGEQVGKVLVPVYRALGIPWDPSTAGDLVSEAPGTRFETVREAIIDQFALRHRLVAGPVHPETLALAARLAPQHVAPAD